MFWNTGVVWKNNKSSKENEIIRFREDQNKGVKSNSGEITGAINIS